MKIIVITATTIACLFGLGHYSDLLGAWAVILAFALGMAHIMAVEAARD